MPTKNLIASSPGTARHCAGRGPAGRSLIGALACLGMWRVILWPVWASLHVVRGSGSHGGRHAASELGSPRPAIITPTFFSPPDPSKLSVSGEGSPVSGPIRDLAERCWSGAVPASEFWKPTGQSEELSPGVVFLHTFANMTVVRTRAGLVLVDTSN